jgi:hypothetical protein
MKPEFAQLIFKNPQISNFMKIHSVAAKMLHADRKTDMMKLIFNIHSFANTHEQIITSSITI